MTVPEPGSLPVVIEPLGDRAALAAEWRALEADAAPSPYLSWDWIDAWLTAYAPPRPAVVRIGPSGSPPVALGLLAQGSLGRWEFAGAPVSPNRGLLVAVGHDDAAWGAMAGELRRRGDWMSLGVEGVPLAAGQLPGAHLEPMSSWVVDLPSTFEEYLSQRSSAQRKAHKQKLRRLENADGRVAVVDPSEHRAALHTFLEFHALRAAAKGERHPQMNEDLTALLARMHAGQTHRLLVLALEIAGQTAALSIRLDRHDGGGAWFFNGGFDPTHQRLGPGVTLELASIRDSIERGHRRFDLGPGLWRYKTDLGGQEHPLFDGEAFNPSVRGRAMHMLLLGRRRAYQALPGRGLLQGLRRRRVSRGRSSTGSSTAG